MLNKCVSKEYVVGEGIGCSVILTLFFFNDTATTEIYTLSLHDALPICRSNTPKPDGPKPSGQAKNTADRGQTTPEPPPKLQIGRAHV